MPEHGYSEIHVRVRPSEADSSGTAHEASFLVWFECGRIEHFRACGVSYKEMEQEDGLIGAVVGARCQYKSPARPGDRIRLRTCVTRRRGPMIAFRYEAVHAVSGRLLAEGETTHVFIDRNFRPRPLPEKYEHPLRRGPRDLPSPPSR